MNLCPTGHHSRSKVYRGVFKIRRRICRPKQGCCRRGTGLRDEPNQRIPTNQTTYIWMEKGDLKKTLFRISRLIYLNSYTITCDSEITYMRTVKRRLHTQEHSSESMRQRVAIPLFNSGSVKIEHFTVKHSAHIIRVGLSAPADLNKCPDTPNGETRTCALRTTLQHH